MKGKKNIKYEATKKPDCVLGIKQNNTMNVRRRKYETRGEDKKFMCVGESDNEKMCGLEVRLVYAKHGMGEAWGKGVVDRKIQNEIKKRTISMKQRQKGLKQQKKKKIPNTEDGSR